MPQVPSIDGHICSTTNAADTRQSVDSRPCNSKLIGINAIDQYVVLKLSYLELGRDQSPLQHHIEHHDVSWRADVIRPLQRFIVWYADSYRATTRGRPYGIISNIMMFRGGRMSSAPYNDLSIDMWIRTGRPCGSGATVSHPHCGQTQPSCTTELRHKSRADGLRPFGPHPHLRHHRASPPTYTAQPVGCVAQPTLKSEKFRSNCFCSKVGVS